MSLASPHISNVVAQRDLLFSSKTGIGFFSRSDVVLSTVFCLRATSVLVTECSRAIEPVGSFAPIGAVSL